MRRRAHFIRRGPGQRAGFPSRRRLALCWRVSQYISAQALADAWDHLLKVGEGA